MCNLHQSNLTQAPKDKFGYLDIKQSSKVRPRKLKTWRRRWVVLTQLSKLSGGNEYAAKLDLYDNEKKWRNNSSDKDTFVLENVTNIKTTPSRTHQHAFEVVERQPMLVMSGASELESYSWILALQQIFTPQQIETPKGSYRVTVLDNEHSSQWNLSGEFILSVSPTCVSLGDLGGTSEISWALSTIIKFKVDKNPSTGQMTVLVIESGPNSPTGQSCFKFLSDEAHDILCAIKQSICQAQAQMQQSRSGISPRQRKLGCAVSIGSIENLLDNHHAFSSKLLHRSDSSDSFCSTLSHGSAAIPRGFSSSPMSTLTRGHLSTELGLLVEAEENIQASIAQMDERDMLAHKIMTKDKMMELVHTRSSSHPIKTLRSISDYNKIKDVTPKEPPAPRRNSYTGESSGLNIERLRSISTVVALIKSSCDHKPGRTVSFENDNENKSDFDSAIQSMTLSVANDDIPWTDLQCFKDWCSAKGCDPLLLKKSSSTPDLQAYWKRLGDVPKFENVYEDLDELGCPLQRFSKKKDPDTPPALPARPLSLSFTSSNDYSSKTSMKKRSILRRNEKCNSAEIKNITSASTCDSIKGQTPGSPSDFVQSTACEDGKFTQRTKSNIKMNSKKEESLAGFCWYIDDINNRIIPELQLVKRRRSSDINILASFDAQTIDQVNSKASSLPSYGKDSHTLSGSSSNIKNLISDSKRKTNPELRAAALKPVIKSVKSSSSNPLISFFLDDANFESHPMVAGKLPNPSISLSSNINLVTKDTTLSSPPQIPGSSSAEANEALIFHGVNTELIPDPGFSLSGNIAGSFDVCSMDTVFKQSSSINKDPFMSSIYSNQFLFDPIILKQDTGHRTSSDNMNMHDNYMAMMANLESPSHDINETAENCAFSCEHQTAIEKQVRDIYIQPNV